MKTSPEYLPEYLRKPIVIMGCGNSLKGDDGFGPAVIDMLQKKYIIPKDVCTLDAGTAIRSFLFDLNLSERKPEKLIIIDSTDEGRAAGEIFELTLDEYLPASEKSEKEIWTHSLHEAPALELLRSLSGEMEIIVLLCQVESIQVDLKIGLSRPVEKAVYRMCDIILQKYVRLE